MVTDPVDRAEEFIQLFNQVESFLSLQVGPKKLLPFVQLVDAASIHSAAVRANNGHLKRFAKLRNAIVHDAEYPPHIVAVPSQEALLRFKGIAQEVLEPSPLIPTFATQVHSFTPSDRLSDVLRFMRKHDFSQVIVRGEDRRLSILTVEGITKWLADEVDGIENLASKTTVNNVLSLEPPGGFVIMGPKKTIFDAVDAFSNAVHINATRLYAIAITKDGSDSEDPIGFVTPWDLVHNPRLRQEP
jgi:CBS domain-containing protein